MAEQDRQTGRRFAGRSWDRPQPLRRASKVVLGSMMKLYRESTFSVRTSRISRVVQLPIKSQITFGGAPRSRLSPRKSSSFVTIVKSAAAAKFQMS
jgi:hypothetical protein